MRLFQLIDGLGAGGAERSLVELVPFYRDAGIKFRLICLKPSSKGFQDAVEGRVEMNFVESTDLFGRVREVRRILAEGRPNLLHTTLFQSDIIGRFAAAGTRVPVLTSLVNTTYDPVRLRDPRVRGWKLALARMVDGWSGRYLTNHFHAITHAVKKSAVESLKLPAERITVIERGRDPWRLGRPDQERRLRARRALGLSHDDQVVLNVARQEFQKGQRYLLGAAASLRERLPDLKLLIAGREGRETEDLRSLTHTLNLGDRVRFLGHRMDVPEILAAADLFVFPSLYEGLGGALIEAMALGLPIVASDLPAVREVVEDGRNAILCRPCSEEDLVDAIGRLLEQPDLRAGFGERSREIFDSRFTVDRHASRMIDLFETLTTSRN